MSQAELEVKVGTYFQCFGSIFVESGTGSSQKSQTGSGSGQALNPDPWYFFTLSEKNLNYFIIIGFYHQKKSIKRNNVVKVLKSKIMS